VTIEQKVSQLNDEFQKAYYDTDLGCFRFVIPQMLTEMKTVIVQFNERHPVLRDNFTDSLRILPFQEEDIQHFLEIPNPSDAVKDNYLIAMKRNVSQALWRFHDNVYRHDARLLHEIADPEG
jgi:hypothetical protein